MLLFWSLLTVFSLGSCDCEAMAPKKKSEDPADVCCSVHGQLGDLFEETSPPMKRQRQPRKSKSMSTRVPRSEDDDEMIHFAEDAFSHLISLPPMGPTSYRQLMEYPKTSIEQIIQGPFNLLFRQNVAEGVASVTTHSGLGSTEHSWSLIEEECERQGVDVCGGALAHILQCCDADEECRRVLHTHSWARPGGSPDKAGCIYGRLETWLGRTALRELERLPWPSGDEDKLEAMKSGWQCMESTDKILAKQCTSVRGCVDFCHTHGMFHEVHADEMMPDVIWPRKTIVSSGLECIDVSSMGRRKGIGGRSAMNHSVFMHFRKMQVQQECAVVIEEAHLYRSHALRRIYGPDAEEAAGRRWIIQGRNSAPACSAGR